MRLQHFAILAATGLIFAHCAADTTGETATGDGGTGVPAPLPDATDGGASANGDGAPSNPTPAGCTTNADCPFGQRCELASGECVVRPPPSGPAPPWAQGMETGTPSFPEFGVQGGPKPGSGSPGGGGSGEAPSFAPPSSRDGYSAPAPKIEQADEICIDEHTKVVLYMSADDSTSKASPVIARKMIRAGQAVPAGLVRTYEFLNYYTIRYDAPKEGQLQVVPQMVPNAAIPGSYLLQIGVQAPEVLREKRPHLNLTFTLDNSGSMEGFPMENQKAVLRAIASELTEGDIISLVTWDTTQLVLLDSHIISTPDDKTFLAAIDSLMASGGTDLNRGLEKGYELAKKNHDKNRLNRVVVISDGMANVGKTSADVIAESSEDGENAGIYLVGIGTGNGYDDQIMDTLTDRGKGGYLYVDSADEAERQFTGRNFIANLGIAAMDVRMRLKLPPGFRVLEFHGEQISGSPDLVKPQHLAPNTAMVYHQLIGSCANQDFMPEDVLEVHVEWVDPKTRQNLATDVAARGEDLLADLAGAGRRPQLIKGNAVVAYAESLKLLEQASRAAAEDVCGRALTVVDAAAVALPADFDLTEVQELLTTYCSRCTYNGCDQAAPPQEEDEGSDPCAVNPASPSCPAADPGTDGGTSGEGAEGAAPEGMEGGPSEGSEGGESADAGSWEPECVGDWECGPSEVCYAGHCEPAGTGLTGCTSNADCAAFEHCDLTSKFCLPGSGEPECTSNADCGPGLYCNTFVGECRPSPGSLDAGMGGGKDSGMGGGKDSGMGGGKDAGISGGGDASVADGGIALPDAVCRGYVACLAACGTGDSACLSACDSARAPACLQCLAEAADCGKLGCGDFDPGCLDAGWPCERTELSCKAFDAPPPEHLRLCESYMTCISTCGAGAPDGGSPDGGMSCEPMIACSYNDPVEALPTVDCSLCLNGLEDCLAEYGCAALKAEAPEFASCAQTHCSAWIDACVQ